MSTSPHSHQSRDGQTPHPCCVPSKAREQVMLQSKAASERFRRISSGSTERMIKLDGGAFLMGTDTKEGFPADGEGPVREVHVDPFYVDTSPVTNEQFAEFARATGYISESERFGWSYVFHNQLAPERKNELTDATIEGLDWWCKVNHADWKHPYGPDSSISGFEQYPVTHIAWLDAAEYAQWAGKRLPTEAEWEYASRGGLEQALFPWGDELEPDGRHLCNVWQGEFPNLDTADDGYAGLSPVDAFPANGYGILSITGNAWEWCRDWWSPSWHVHATRQNPIGPPGGERKVVKGGSFLCHRSYCNRYRVAARTSNTPDSATINMTFRCVRDC
ncbi:MAG: SUMF1/EgtB/PvdO family nonheme iron enzyme [Chitinivibrionales bacterium]|nr:SUMF1/EgtB/PvdO family nonheme iron enzyme [Chitinivibrionales bacterium]